MNCLDGLRCPWCHDRFSSDDDLVVCRDCLAAHHAACWAESDACATCARARPLQAPPPRARWRSEAGWVRGLAAITATYLVSGPIAGLLGLALDLLGARPQATDFYAWCLLACVVLFFGLLGAGGWWALVRLGSVALGEHPLRLLRREPAQRDRRTAIAQEAARRTGQKGREVDATLSA